jgi:uncharacterized phage protein (TIGR01671 family)
MREIKFKAWCEEMNDYVCDEDLSQFVWRIEQGQLSLYDPLFAIKELVLMQYTGLKDKNGVEIYEGDLLRLWREDGEYYKPLEVHYCALWCQFVVEDVQNKEQFGIRQDFEEFEVIGNIHSNPELIEG